MAITKFWSNRRGATMVEFALGSVVLLTVIFAAAALGLAVFRYNTVAAMAKRGAHFAAVHGIQSGSVADSAAVQAFVDSQGAGIPLIVHTTWPDGGSKAPGKRVQVRVNNTFFSPIRGLIPSNVFILQSTAQDMIVR